MMRRVPAVGLTLEERGATIKLTKYIIEREMMMSGEDPAAEKKVLILSIR